MKQWQTLFSWAPKSLQMVSAVMNIKTLGPWKKSYDQLRQHIKKQRHHFADKGLHIVEIVLFLVAMYRCEELNHKEGWARKNWCFWIVMLDKILESPLDNKKIKPVNLREINPKYSLEGLLLKLKLQYFGQLMQRTDSLEKTLKLG